LEFVSQAHEAAGFPPVSPSDKVRHDELGSIPATQIALAFGFDMDSILRVYRVYGENLRRIAQVESQQYHEKIDVPLQQQRLSHAEVFAQGAAFGEQVMEVLDQALLAVYHRHREAAWDGRSRGAHRGRARRGRLVREARPAAGDDVPRPHGVHETHRGARGRRGGGDGSVFERVAPRGR
jgi:hypothetical protein